MDEDLLFKSHKESKIPDNYLSCKEIEKQNIFSLKSENGFSKEEENYPSKIPKNRQKKTVEKVLKNCDYKTNILSNALESNITSPLLSNVCYYSFSNEYLGKIRKTNKCVIRNHKNENIFRTNKKMLIVNDTCDSGFNSIMKDNQSDRIFNRILCDFQEPCLSNRQSNLKRKLESDVINELSLRLDERDNLKSTTYIQRIDGTLSYSKHFKSDDSAQTSENRNERLFLQSHFINKINSIENYNLKQVKNIEVQSSPAKIRVAANFGDDSVEYVDPTMEVELDSDENDPDDPEEPEEQTAEAADEPHEQDLSHEDNSGGDGETPQVNMSNIENEDDSGGDGGASQVNVSNIECEGNVIKTENGHPNNSSIDDNESNSIIKQQCLNQVTSDITEADENVLNGSEAKVDYKEHKSEEEKVTDMDYEKISPEMITSSPDLSNFPTDTLNQENKATTDISELNQTENDSITLDKVDGEVRYNKSMSEVEENIVSTPEFCQTEVLVKEEVEGNAKKQEEFENNSVNETFIDVSEVEAQVKTSKDFEDTILNKDEILKEQTEYAEENESEKQENNRITREDIESGRQEEFSKTDEGIEVDGYGSSAEENKTIQNDISIELSENNSKKENDEHQEEVKFDKTNETFDDQENGLHRNDSSIENGEIHCNENIEDNTIDNAGSEAINPDEEQVDNVECSENNYYENSEKNGIEETEYAKQGNENTSVNENTRKDSICKIEEGEKETTVDSEKSESIDDEITKTKDIENTEMKLDIVNGEVSIKETEIFNTMEHEPEKLNETANETEENDQEQFENVEEQIDSQLNMKINENNVFEEQLSLENLSHQSVENEEDNIERDSIEDVDNYQSTEKRTTESQDLCSNLEKESSYQNKNGTSEIISEELEIQRIKDESPSIKSNESTQKSDQVQNSSDEQLILEEHAIKNGDLSEKSDENDEKDVLNHVINDFSNTSIKTTDLDENITPEGDKDNSIIAKEIESDVRKVSETVNHVSKNFSPEIADENNSENERNSLFPEEETDDVKVNLTEEQQNESKSSEIEKNDDEKNGEISEEGRDKITKEPSLTYITQDTTGQILMNDESFRTSDEKKAANGLEIMQNSAPAQYEERIRQNITDEAMVRSSEKQKTDKPEQSSFDSVKVISPRKGIKVEDDEIETAISSIVFSDEMSDGNEQIVQTVPSAVFSKPYEEAILSKYEDTEITVIEKSDEITPTNLNDELLSSQAMGESEKVVSDEAKTQPSPKKRKKKRKISRSRSAQKGGPSSATKRSQDSKGSANSRTSRSVSSTSARSPSAGEKKLPPIKAPVGTTPPPNIKQVKSKIGSLQNVTHKPKGGDKKVESVKLEWNARPKVGSLDYATHKPGGGDKKIVTQKLDFKNVQSRVGSKENLKHKPGGGNLKISTEKLDFKAKAASKVGSLDNAKHKPGGGNVAIKSEKLHFKDRASSKINSRSGSERGSSHGGSETQSPVMPSSPAPPEELPPLNEDENPSSQEESKPETSVEKAECNGGGENMQEAPSNDASSTKSEEVNDANEANNANEVNEANEANQANDANNSEDAKEDQLIAF